MPEDPPVSEAQLRLPTTPIQAFDQIPMLAFTPEWMISMEGRELLRLATCYLLALQYIIRYYPEIWEEILALPEFRETGVAPIRK